MSKEEFETYLALVSSLLQLTPEQREQISDELYDHLENRVSDLVRDGVDRDAAIAQAVEEFGDASALATNLKNVSSDNRKVWMMRFATLCTAAAFLFGVFLMAVWPEESRFGGPSPSVAQEETVDDNPFSKQKDRPEVAGTKVSPDSGIQVPDGGKTGPRPYKPTANADVRSNGILSDDEIREKLKAICNFDFDQTPASEVITLLEHSLGVNVVLTQCAIDDSLPEDETISSSLSKISYSDALRIMLAPKNATYCIHSGVIKFISLDEKDDPKWFVRKMIDVGETLKLIREFESERIGQPAQQISAGGIDAAGRQGGGMFSIQSGVGAGGLEGGDKRSEVQELARAIVESIEKSSFAKSPRVMTAESMLLDAIQESIVTDGWSQHGGQMKITCVGGILIVNASEDVIVEVTQFVEDLTDKLRTKKQNSN